MFQVQIMGLNPVTNAIEPIKIDSDGRILTSGNNLFKVESITIVILNIIPDLAFAPLSGALQVLANSSDTVAGTDWTISSKTITWNAANAGYNLDPGDIVKAIYMYAA